MYFRLYCPVRRVRDTEATKHGDDVSSRETHGTDHDNLENADSDDLQKSHSSTIAGEILKPHIVV